MTYIARLVEPEVMGSPFPRRAKMIVTGYAFEQTVEIIHQVANRKNLQVVTIIPL